MCQFRQKLLTRKLPLASKKKKNRNHFTQDLLTHALCPQIEWKDLVLVSIVHKIGKRSPSASSRCCGAHDPPLDSPTLIPQPPALPLFFSFWQRFLCFTRRLGCETERVDSFALRCTSPSRYLSRVILELIARRLHPPSHLRPEKRPHGSSQPLSHLTHEVDLGKRINADKRHDKTGHLIPGLTNICVYVFLLFLCGPTLTVS